MKIAGSTYCGGEIRQGSLRKAVLKVLGNEDSHRIGLVTIAEAVQEFLKRGMLEEGAGQVAVVWILLKMGISVFHLVETRDIPETGVGEQEGHELTIMNDAFGRIFLLEKVGLVAEDDLSCRGLGGAFNLMDTLLKLKN